jgi:Niemann-Pick C1 protein
VNLLTNTWTACFITVIVAATSWGLLGVCYLWNKSGAPYDIQINAVSVVNWVMCIGLSVEFNIHIITYFWRKKGTRYERSRKALENMGSTVLTGIAATKLIGVSVLGLAPSMIF